MRHEFVFDDKTCEPSAQVSLLLKLVKQGAMVEISVREDAVDTSSDGAQSLHGTLLDIETTGEVFVAVQERSSSMESVEGVVQG